MSFPEPGVHGAGVATPQHQVDAPVARCWSMAKSSAIFTGSFVVIRVVAVERMILSVRAAR